MAGWLAILHHFQQHILVISGHWVGDKERLYAVEPYLRLKRSLPQAGLEPLIARSVGQRLTY